ncbi:chlorohydrolase [Streptococcus pneumoniae]|nr:chlorohydrolase [Streptococcus pneumoniae]
MKIKEQTRQLATGCSKRGIKMAAWFEEIFEEYETKTYSF